MTGGTLRCSVIQFASVIADHELLEAWRRGDKEAGSELFERHFDRLYNFLRSAMPDGIDDLVQKTMLACVEGRDRIKGEFCAYMLGAARQLVYREYDRRQRDGNRIDYGVTSAHDLAPSPSSIMASHDRSALMYEAMRRIPFDYHVAIELYYLQGLRGPQLAESLGVPEGTARSRVRRGIRHLRKCIAELEANPALRRDASDTVDRWERELADAGDPEDAA